MDISDNDEPKDYGEEEIHETLDKMEFGDQYSYFQEEIYDRPPELLFDELDLNVFVDAYHGHNMVIGSSITWILSVVGSTPTTWSPKRYTSVQKYTLGAKFIALKKAAE